MNARGPIGLSFKAQADPEVIDRLAAAAGRHGFAALSVWDDLGDPSPVTLLFALGRLDREARLGFACLAVPKYAAWDGVAGLVSTLSAMRNGPVFVGLAAGAWMEQMGLRAASVARVREAAGVLRYLLEHREDGFEGLYYRVAPGFRLGYETTPERLPIMIGGWGERMLYMAGEVADEVKVGGSAAAGMALLARERIAPGARAAGRDPRSIDVVLGAVTVVSEDRNAALAEARRRAATYIPVIGRLDPVAASDFPDALAAISEASSRGDAEAAMRSIPDALLARFAFAGSPDDVIAQVEAALAAGASRVDFGSPHGLDAVTGIDLLGTRVLPYFAP